jgi:hypothetical protein
MMVGLDKENPGASSRPGLSNCTRLNISRTEEKGQLYLVYHDDGDPFEIRASGRFDWALDELIKAGPRGIIPMENPAPRWSAYIHGLRSLGIEIDTVMEPHEGPFPGKHGRYVLQSLVLKGGAA